MQIMDYENSDSRPEQAPQQEIIVATESSFNYNVALELRPPLVYCLFPVPMFSKN